MKPEKIYETYKPRIEKVMKEIADYLKENSDYHVSEPEDVSCDDYEWNVNISPDDTLENSVDINLIICESEHWDGEKNGVTFRLDIVAYGGEILGGFSPYNYTDSCWVDRSKPEEIDERFRMFENLEYYDILNNIYDFFERQRKVS